MTTEPVFLYGLHDAGGEGLFQEADVQGWLVFNEFIGRDPGDASGVDYSSWADRGFGVIVKLQHGFNPLGTIPEPDHFQLFAERCARFAAVSEGCSHWVIGNEMNFWASRPRAKAREYVPLLKGIETPAEVHAVLRALPERFEALQASPQPHVTATRGIPLTPDLYAACYRMCRNAILAAQPAATVLTGAVTPWNSDTRYAGNEHGDWAEYLKDILVRLGPHGCDGLALLAPTVDGDPRMDRDAWLEGDFQSRRRGFRAYRDFMQSIPINMRHLPVYIVETDQFQPWEDRNSGWVRNAYAEIDDWNKMEGTQQIRCLALFRWARSPGDRWGLSEKQGVRQDLLQAMSKRHEWNPSRVPLADPTDSARRESLVAGVVVEAKSALNLRRIPGFIGVPADQIVARVQVGHQCYIADGPVRMDSLIWWHVHATELDGQQVSGWVPQAGVDGEPYLKKITGAPDFSAPFEPAPVHQDESLTPGTYFLLLEQAELRQSPGREAKDAGDVLLVIPENSPGLILEGPQYVGDDVWWRVRMAYPEENGSQGWIQENVSENERNLQVIAIPGTKPTPAPSFELGSQVFAHRAALLRRVPGLAAWSDDDVIVQVATGQELTVERGPRRVDDLLWWEVSTQNDLLPLRQGWIAESSASGYVQLGSRPPEIADSGDHEFQPGSTLYIVSECTLRRTPGRSQKTDYDQLDIIGRNTLCVALASPESAEGTLWWQISVTGSSRESQWGWVGQTDADGQAQISSEPLPVQVAPVPRRSPSERESRNLQVGDRVMNVSPQTVRIRATPGDVGKGEDDILLRVPRRGLMAVHDGPREVDGLRWWKVELEYPETTQPAGWVTDASRSGLRILAYDFLADHIKVANPFHGQYPVSQAWGSNPQFYGRFSYSGVRLKGHNGFDFAMPVGTPLLACDAGRVLRVSYGNLGLGKYVLLQHDWGESLYGHMDEIDVQVSQVVPLGGRIGVSGNTGNSTGPHLHFGIKVLPYRRGDGWGGYCNPAPFMDVNRIFKQRPVHMPPSGIGEDGPQDPLP